MGRIQRFNIRKRGRVVETYFRFKLALDLISIAVTGMAILGFAVAYVISKNK